MTTTLDRGKGQFGGAALAGTRAFDARDLVSNDLHFGLVREATYCWGTVRNREGDLFIFARRMAAPGGAAGADVLSSDEPQHSMSDRFMLQSTIDGADHPVLRKEGRFSAVSDVVERRLEDGRAVFHIPAHEQRGALDLTAGDDVVNYREGDLVEVSGERIGPGLHWFVPGGTSSLYYPTQTWSVAGTILGHEVEGFLFIEEAYLPPGGRLYITHDPLPLIEYRTWYSWATRWDDGTTEFGHFLANDDRFGVGIIANGDGSARFAQNVLIEVERDADGYWYDRIALDVDGEAWEIVADPKGRMADLGPIPNPQQEAHVRRVGETRKPVSWMAWGETVPTNDATH